MPMVNAPKPFILKELLNGAVFCVKYLAQIGNGREKYRKRSEVISLGENPWSARPEPLSS